MWELKGGLKHIFWKATFLGYVAKFRNLLGRFQIVTRSSSCHVIGFRIRSIFSLLICKHLVVPTGVVSLRLYETLLKHVTFFSSVALIHNKH